MSQWSNRFSVLDVHSTIEDSLSSNTEPPKIISETPSLPSLPEKIYIRSTTLKFSTHLDVLIKTLDTGVSLPIHALLDCGATGQFLDTRFVREHNLNTRKLPRAIPVYNVDGTLNQGGSIKEEVDVIMSYKDHTERVTFAVCDLGDKMAIIGHTWLYCHNPEINWQTGEVKLSRCPSKCHVYKQEKKERQKRRKITGTPPLLLEEEGDDLEPRSNPWEDR
ncbi:13307_t:CDS:1, partial [Acaulospora colombiana]